MNLWTRLSFWKPVVVVAALAFAVGACAQPGPISPGPVKATTDPLAQIATFTIADLQAADADAVAHHDAISHACYPALITFVSALQGTGATATVRGAFSAYQHARDVRLGVESGLPDYLKLGCAALVQDEALFLTRLGLIGAGSAVIGPIAPAIIPGG